VIDSWETNHPNDTHNMKKIIKILMDRDGLSKEEAEDQVQDFSNRLHSGNEDPFELAEEFECEFGLEPDYFEQLLFQF